MKIVNIFAYKLFAIHYDGEVDNEYDRLLDLWNNTEYVKNFLDKNESDIPSDKTKKQFVQFIRENAIKIDEQLIEITESGNVSLSNFFRPLDNREFQFKILSLQKGRQYCLRLYAVKIDEDIFVVTGGAIKLPLQHLMEHREHTKIELNKLNAAKHYFKSQDVFNDESFFEFLSDIY